MQNELIGHFRVRERIGAGGMGTVHRAEDVRLGREVALKFLSPNVTGDPTARERFLREARAAAAIDHPNVCTVHEVGEADDGTIYLAMPLYRGETLSRRLRGGPLSPAEAVRVAAQLLAGLEQAHARGIYHRDLKPSNVFLTADGTVKLLDFGLARLADDSRLTGSGTVVGTAAYMSPELVLAQDGDHRADLWSAGVVLYEMLAGRLPFAGASEASLVYAIAHNEPRPLREVRPELPEPLLALVDRCLRKEPDERYGSAGVLRRDLEALQHALATHEPVTEAFPTPAPMPRPSRPGSADAGVSTPSVSTQPGSPTATTLAHRRPSRRWAVSAAVALLLIGGALVWFLPRGAGAAPGPLPRNLAVLPIANQSGDPRLEPVARGLGAVLVDQLGAVPALDVVPYDEVLQVYRRKPLAGATEVAREMGSDAVLRGTLHVVDEETRVELELLDGASGAVRWSHTVAEQTARLAGLQERLAQQVTTDLLGSLAGGPRARLSGSEQAYAKYLQAEARFAEADQAGEIPLVESLLRGALVADPAFAAVHARLAELLVMRTDSEPDPRLLTDADEHARRALQLAPSLPVARLAVAKVALARHRPADAVPILQALASEYPNLDEAQVMLADALTYSGQLGAAERTLRQTLQRRPGYWLYWDRLGSLLLNLGELGQAREAYLKAASLTRFEYGTPYRNLAALELTQGKFAAALAAFDKMPRPIDDPLVASNIGTAYYYLGDYTRAVENYRLATRLAPHPAFLANLGDAYAKLGRLDAARDSYGRAAEVLVASGHDPSLEDRAREALYLAKAGRCGERAEVTRAAAGEPMLSAEAAANLAKAAAVCNAGDSTYAMLRRALELGYSPARAVKDEEFHAIAASARFRATLANAAAS